MTAPLHTNLPPAQRQGIVREQPIYQQIPFPTQILHSFCGLDHTHTPDEAAEDSTLLTGGNLILCRCEREPTPQTGAFSWQDSHGLPLELNSTSIGKRPLREHGTVVNEKLR